MMDMVRLQPSNPKYLSFFKLLVGKYPTERTNCPELQKITYSKILLEETK